MSDSEIPPVVGPVQVEPGAVAPAAGVLGPSWQEQDGVLRDLWMQNKTPQEISDVLTALSPLS